MGDPVMTTFLSVRVRVGEQELIEVDAGVPNLYLVADLLRAVVTLVGDHAEACEERKVSGGGSLP